MQRDTLNKERLVSVLLWNVSRKDHHRIILKCVELDVKPAQQTFSAEVNGIGSRLSVHTAAINTSHSSAGTLSDMFIMCGGLHCFHCSHLTMSENTWDQWNRDGQDCREIQVRKKAQEDRRNGSGRRVRRPPWSKDETFLTTAPFSWRRDRSRLTKRLDSATGSRQFVHSKRKMHNQKKYFLREFLRWLHFYSLNHSLFLFQVFLSTGIQDV